MRTYFIALITLVIFQSSCKKLDKLTQFDMDYNEPLTIPSSSPLNLPFNIITPDVKSNSESTFAVNDTRKDLIKEIKLTILKISITSPENGNFNFLKSVSIFLNADGLPETKIAYKENIENNSEKLIQLSVVDTDLQEFIKKDNFTIKLSTVTDELIATDYKVNVYCLFHVNAKILGQ